MRKGVETQILKFWYGRASFIHFILLPFSLLFFFIIQIRYFLYYIGLKKRFSFPQLIIIVGNITVGGTGKTPLVIWLAHFLKAKGFSPGIVSRGSGGKKHITPYWVQTEDDPKRVGDEALLLMRRTGCPTIISKDRALAVKELLEKTKCNIVLADDGLQHYRLKRDMEIVVIDGERQLGNGFLLPAGPLRELPSRLKKVDLIVQKGEDAGRGWQMSLKGETVVSLIDKDNIKKWSDFRGQRVHAVAAIGNPSTFFFRLREEGLNIIEHVFPDHHLFTLADFSFEDKNPIIMTEKDAVKCQSFATPSFWYVRVTAKLSKGFEEAFLMKLNSIQEKKYAQI